MERVSSQESGVSFSNSLSPGSLCDRAGERLLKQDLLPTHKTSLQKVEEEEDSFITE